MGAPASGVSYEATKPVALFLRCFGVVAAVAFVQADSPPEAQVGVG